MIQLPTEFTRNGWRFKQLRREGQVALFEKFYPDVTDRKFEVVIIQQHTAKSVYGVEYPDRESMPHSESWGQAGWTPVGISRALELFSEISDRENLKSAKI